MRTTRRTIARMLTIVLATMGGVALTVDPAAAATTVRLVTTQTLGPGDTQHRIWNNANSDAYAVGLRGTPADGAGSCFLQVVRSWYERHPSGEREFHYEFTNNSGLEVCVVEVYLASFDAFRTSSFGELAPGASAAKVWNNAHTDRYIYLTGAVPSQPASGVCRIETAGSYRSQPDGETEFVHSVRNVGSISCSAEVRMVQLNVSYKSSMGSGPSPTGLVTLYPATNSVPASMRVFVPGAVPSDPAAPCQLEVRRSDYLGPRFISMSYGLVGTNTCDFAATAAFF